MPKVLYTKQSLSEVQNKLSTALQLLYKNDLFLIENSTNERSITHKLAEYIQQLFPEWHVDCEYNRRGEKNVKEINGQTTSYPDIIIHRRNTKDNLLVIEAKSVHSQNHDEKKDKQKITHYIEDSRYSYKYGLWIFFHDELRAAQLDCFENRNGFCCEVK